MEVSKDPLSTILDVNDLEDDIQHVNNPIVGLEPIVKKYLAAVKEYRQEGNSFFFSDGSAQVEVRVVSDEIIRSDLPLMEYSLRSFPTLSVIQNKKLQFSHVLKMNIPIVFKRIQ